MRATAGDGGRVGAGSPVWDHRGITDDAPDADDHSVLQAERDALARIDAAHRAHLERARALAARLAGEAADTTEEGIRDLVDPDAEVDAAVRAAQVRQSAASAVHAVRRAQELEARGRPLVFGHVTDDDGERSTVGLMSVFEGDDPLVIDWRAPASIPFYRATPVDRLGVARRRHLLFDERDGAGAQLVSYSDEVFDVEALRNGHGLRGEAAILAALDAPTEDQMRTVVATIQAEQDAVVRAPSEKPLLVQGGPGTGKTVVALHRAAYLLYDARVELAEHGVLIVGPSRQFLHYIADVLPSLGESGVVSGTVTDLFPGVRLGRAEHRDVARVKGRAAMADVLANFLALRQRPPTGPLDVGYGASRVRLELDVLLDAHRRASRLGTHNEGASELRSTVIEALVGRVVDPSFADGGDALRTFRGSTAVRRFLLARWPPLTPEQALNDLLGSPALLRRAAAGTDLDPDDLVLLGRPRIAERDLDDARWSDADVPLLDELWSLLGPVGGPAEDERIRERDEDDEFAAAQRADDRDGQDDPDEIPAEDAESWELLAEQEDLDVLDEGRWDG